MSYVKQILLFICLDTNGIFLKGITLQNDKLSKVDCAYELLKSDILNVKIPPDTPLKMTWLQKHYNVGSTPLREALTRLESDHLVILQPNKGYIVASASIGELMELYTSRKIIKLHLLDEAIRFGDKYWESDIVATHYRLSRELSPFDEECDYNGYISWTKAHDAFDNALIAAHRSPWLNRFNLLLTEHIRRQGRVFRLLMPSFEKQSFSNAALKSPALRSLYALERYTDLKEAVLDRNFNQVTTFVNKHLDLVMATYKELYVEDD